LISIIEEHLTLNHSFEVSWSLWMLITFRIKCPRKLAEKILESKDAISKLICLHLIEETLYDGRKPNLKKIKEEIKISSSFGENWLLIYETIVKEWIEYDDVDDILDNEYFSLMTDYDVSFYDIDKQIRPKVSMVYDPFSGYGMIEVEYDEAEEEWY